MLSDFLVYPDAQAILKDSGLEMGIVKFKKNYFITDSFGGEDESYCMLNELRKRKWIDTLPDPNAFLYSLDRLIHDGGNWHIQREKIARTLEDDFLLFSGHDLSFIPSLRTEHLVQHAFKHQDFPVLSGYWASHILKKRDWAKPEKFGFKSIAEMHAVIGARITQDDGLNGYRDGHIWESEGNGQHFRTQVTGDGNGDFRLFRSDLTPYKTITPLGDEVRCRPELHEDRQIVAPYHSVEPSIFVAAMKYAEQEGVKSNYLDPEGMKAALKGLKGPSSPFAAPYADFGTNNRGHESLLFIPFFYELPRFDAKGVSSKRSTFDILCQFGGGYAVGVGPNGGFAFVYFSGEREATPDFRLEIPKTEFDEFIKGLYVQTARGLGRTSLDQLVKLVEYRHSDAFKTDKEEHEQRCKPH